MKENGNIPPNSVKDSSGCTDKEDCDTVEIHVTSARNKQAEPQKCSSTSLEKLPLKQAEATDTGGENCTDEVLVISYQEFQQECVLDCSMSESKTNIRDMSYVDQIPQSDFIHKSVLKSNSKNLDTETYQTQAENVLQNQKLQKSLNKVSTKKDMSNASHSKTAQEGTSLLNKLKIQEKETQEEKCADKEDNADFETTDGDILPSKPPRGCVSITKFFTPKAKETPPAKAKQGDRIELVVVADVHTSPSSESTPSVVCKTKSLSLKQHKLKQKKRNSRVHWNAVADGSIVNLTIQHIETTYVTVDEPNRLKSDASRSDSKISSARTKQEKKSKHESDWDFNKTDNSNEQKVLNNQETMVSSSQKKKSSTEGHHANFHNEESMKEGESPTKTVDDTKRKDRKKQAILDFVSKRTPKGNNQAQMDLDVATKEKSDKKPVECIQAEAVHPCTPKIERRSEQARNCASDESSSFQKEGNKKRQRKILGEADINVGVVTPEKQVVGDVYKATLLNPKKHKKGTPLKMKFTRVPKKSPNDEELFTPKTKSRKQQIIANKLLHKVKSSGKSKADLKQRKKLKHHKVTETPLRRSCRTSFFNAHLTMHLSSEDSKRNIIKSQSGTRTNKLMRKMKMKQVPKKKLPLSKKTVKIAPIFKKAALLGNKGVELTKEQKEAQAIRRDFLMSGVPEKLKQHMAMESMISLPEYAPLPRISHIQQITESVDVWQLPEHPLCALPLQVKDEEACHTLFRKRSKMELTDNHVQQSQQKVKNEHVSRPNIKEEIIPYLLAEIQTNNPLFPVHHIYQQLLTKKRDAEDENSQDTEVMSNCTKQTGPKGRKRRQSDQSDMETICRRKRKRAIYDDVIICEEHHHNTHKQQQSKASCNDTKNLSAVVQKDELDSKETMTLGKDLLWTEKYSPHNSGEILGNSVTVRKVMSWLTEWKKRADLEAKKALKGQLQGTKNEGNAKKYFVDNSEDDVSSDENEDEQLCNTMLITGPHGCGKTSMVYALAEELGYKVFEVNAASRRTGKQILSQLQEATQSHQVSSQNIDHNSKDTKASKQVSPPVSTKSQEAFASFFTKQIGQMKQDKIKNEVRKDRHSEKQAKTMKKQMDKASYNRKNGDDSITFSQNTKKKLNLSSVSLIVFEEADVVFEEDKGFFVAIETFISTTKRPILLTASDPHFKEKFSRNIEHVYLSPPSQELLTSYLQLVCLVENLRVSFHQLHPLVAAYKNDLRKLLLSLQLWAESGASCQQCVAPVCYSKRYLKKTLPCNISKHDVPHDNIPVKSRTVNEKYPGNSNRFVDDSKSDDEFKVEKQRNQCTRKKRNKVEKMSGIDDSGYALANEESYCQKDSSLQEQFSVEPEEIVERAFDDNTPMLEDMIFYSITGGSSYLHNWQANSSGLQVFCLNRNHPMNRSLYNYYLNQNIDLVYTNFVQLMPLPKVKMFQTLAVPSSSQKALFGGVKKVKNFANIQDVFSSDGSEEEWFSLKKPSSSKQISQGLEETNMQSDNDERNEFSSNSKVNSLLIGSLNKLASVYDVFSFMDSHFTLPKMEVEGPCLSEDFSFGHGHLVSGQLDDEVNCDGCQPSNDIINEFHAWIVLERVNRAREELNNLMKVAKSLNNNERLKVEELMTIPVTDTSDKLCVTDEQNLSQSQIKYTRDLTTKIIQLLPCSATKKSLATDYLPAVRSICRTEQFRMEAEKKRRFYHYLEGMFSQLKGTAVYALCSSLQ